MKQVTAKTAREFLHTVELPTSRPGGYESAPPIIDYDAQKNQSLVVASDVLSFVKGVSPARREAIVNASLLAQLVANKKVPDKSNVIDWYSAYFDVLENIGWVVQEKKFSRYTQDSKGFKTHEAVLQVATALLGSSPAALAIIKTTIEALKSMDASNSWIEIFNRETRSVTTGHFQIGLAEQDEAGQFFVTLFAFSLKADKSLTQVLFFEFRTDEVELRNCSGKITINTSVLDAVQDTLKNKIAIHASTYIAALPDLI